MKTNYILLLFFSTLFLPFSINAQLYETEEFSRPPGFYSKNPTREPIIGFDKDGDYTLEVSESNYYSFNTYKPIGNRTYSTIGKSDVLFGEYSIKNKAQAILDSIENNNIGELQNLQSENLPTITMELNQLALWPSGTLPSFTYIKENKSQSTFTRSYYGFYESTIQTLFQVELIFDSDRVILSLKSGSAIVDYNNVIYEQFKFEKGTLTNSASKHIEKKVVPINLWKKEIEDDTLLDHEYLLNESIIWANQDNEDPYNNCIFILLKKREYQRAAEEATLFLDNYYGNKIVIIYWRGLSYKLNSQYKEAIKDFEYTYKYRKYGLEELVESYLKNNDYNQVLNYAKYGEEDLNILIFKYQALQKLGEKESSQKTLEKANQLVQNEKKLKKKSSFYLKLGEYEKSLATLDSLISLKSDDISLMTDKMELLILNQKYKEAVNHAKTTLRLEGLSAKHRFMLYSLAEDAARCEKDKKSIRLFENLKTSYYSQNASEIKCNSCWNFEYYETWLANNQLLLPDLKATLYRNLHQTKNYLMK